MARDIFQPRRNFKPFEYENAEKFKDAIQAAYWTVKHFSFTSDIDDFQTKMTPIEQGIAKNALLAISQIEISVKKWWAKIGDRMPKAEIDQVGVTCAESEVRHSDAYSHLLKILGLNEEFETLLENPVIQGRVDYLTKYIKNASNSSNEAFSLILALFSLFIENVSLFSQFLIIKSFSQKRKLLKGIDNVVQATQKEETIHALFGVYLINVIKEEHPDWFNQDFSTAVSRACKKAYIAEEAIIDWIFSEGELDFLSKETVKEFTKHRFNESLEMIGVEPMFEVDQEKLSGIQWFLEEIISDVNTDFFHKRPVSYSRFTQTYSADTIF